MVSSFTDLPKETFSRLWSGSQVVQWEKTTDLGVGRVEFWSEFYHKPSGLLWANDLFFTLTRMKTKFLKSLNFPFFFSVTMHELERDLSSTRLPFIVWKEVRRFMERYSGEWQNTRISLTKLLLFTLCHLGLKRNQNGEIVVCRDGQLTHCLLFLMILQCFKLQFLNQAEGESDCKLYWCCNFKGISFEKP